MSFKPHALLFDLNGTMVDDMQYHARAWFHILNHELGANLTKDQVDAQMYGKNEELLVRVFGDRFSLEQMHEIAMEKERRYQHEFRPHLKLIEGLKAFLDRGLKEGIAMGLGTAAIRFNVDFVLDNLGVRKYFDAIVTAQDVSMSKPHPETYLRLAEELNISPLSCLVFEDAPKGVEAAQNAGMKAVAITTMNPPEDFKQFHNVEMVIKDYTDPRIQELFD